MENRENKSNLPDNTEPPVEVLKKIVFATLLTAAAGYLAYFTGLV